MIPSLILWGAWIVVGIVLELLAVAHRVGWVPLSDTLRWMLGIKPHRPWQVPATIVFAGFLSWLAIHITTSLV